jgi:ABC-type antimicrobial peptide transport system permease subunit
MEAGLCAFEAGRELLAKFSSLLPPTGPLALMASAAGIAVIATLAILLPAWRALAIHPREALAGDSR